MAEIISKVGDGFGGSQDYDTLVEWEDAKDGADSGDQVAECWGSVGSSGVVLAGWTGTYSITIRRADNDIPTPWTASYVAIDGGYLIVNDANLVTIQDVSNVTISRMFFTLTGTTANRNAIDFAPSTSIDSVSIDSCVIVGDGGFAGSNNIMVQVGNMLITGCSISNCLIVINNLGGATVRGIELRANSGTSIACDVLNNTIHGMATSHNGLLLIGAGTIDGVIANNAITSTSAPAIVDSITGTDNTVRSNNWTDDTTYQTDDDAGATDRQFVPADAWVNPTASGDSYDFHLTADSELLDVASDIVATDIIGTPRPQGAGTDVGAFETIVATGGPRNRFRLPCRRPQGLLGRPC